MVTFRFYVVSTVAFFLALAVGVLVGSVLDGRIADGLQARLERVETSLDETVDAMDAKNVEIDELSRYVEASAPFAAQGRLDATSTLVVAESGTDTPAVEDLVRRLRESGSRVEGIVWMDPRWDLSEPDDLLTAARLVGADPADPDAVRDAVWSQLLELTGAIEAPGTTATTDTTGAPGATDRSGEPGATATMPPDPSGSVTTADPADPTSTTALPAALLFDATPLADLEDVGLLRLQVIDGGDLSAGGELLLVAATGAESAMAEPGELAIELVRRSGDAGVPSVLAAAAAEIEPGEESDRGALVAAAVEQGSVRFSTVDDLEIIPGRVATVLALADAREGLFGRFGLADGVDGVLPAWKGP